MVEMFSAQEMTGFKVPMLEEMQPSCVTDLSIIQKEVQTWPYICFDIESEGLSFFHHKVVGVSIASRDSHAFYIPLRHKFGDNLDPFEVMPWLADLLSKKVSVAHNAKFDMNMLFGEEALKGKPLSFQQVHCTMLMSQLLYSGIQDKHGLKSLVKRFLNIDMIELEQVITEGENFSYVAIADAVRYSASDAFFTCKLFELFKTKLAEEGLLGIYKIEASCLDAFAELDRIGICIDRSKIDQAIRQSKEQLSKLRSLIFNEAKHEFNIESPKEVATVLYDELGVHPPRGEKGADGYFSTGSKILEDRQEYPICKMLLDFRELEKMLSSFLEKVPEIVCEDGRLRSNFKQIGTRSGRVASSDGIGPGGTNPKLNLQQLPKDKAVDFRALLMPPKDYYWMAADFKQIEYRVMASLAQEQSLIEAFAQDVDFHVKTAAEMLGKDISKVTKKDRALGKLINFAVSYGMTAFSLGKLLNVSAKEAEALMEMYFSKLKNLSRFIERNKQEVYKNHFVRTAFGRIRDFSDITKTSDRGELDALLRSAFNTVIQGTAADINKIALNNVFLAKKQYGDKVLLAMNVHDEVSLFIHSSISIEEAKKIPQAMEQDYTSRGWTRFTVDISYGPNYSDLTSLTGKDLKEEDIKEEVIFKAVVEESFDRIVLIKTSELAEYEKIKSICQPAQRFPYRVVIANKKGIFLLPTDFSCNPTKKIVEILAKIPGVVDVSLVQANDESC